MKSVSLLLVSAALGALSGFAVPARTNSGHLEPPKAAGDPPAGKPALPPACVDEEVPVPATSAGRESLAAELEALRRYPDAMTHEEKAARAAALAAGLSKLEKAGNTDDVLAAIHELAALGIEGYPAALEALAGMGHATEFHGRDRLLDACDGPVVRMAMWAIGDPLHAPEDSRGICAEILSRHFDDHLDAARVMLKALATEEDEDVRLILARTIPLAVPVAVTPTLASARFGQDSNAQAALALARGIASNHWPETEREHALGWMATSSDPDIASIAAAARVSVRPPAAGILIERADAATGRSAPLLKPGDIVLTVDGTALRGVEDLQLVVMRSTNCVVRVRRGPEEIDLGISSGSLGKNLDGRWIEPRP
jgi:hypothetical protein